VSRIKEEIKKFFQILKIKNTDEMDQISERWRIK